MLFRSLGDTAGTCGDPGTPVHASREAGNFKLRSKVRFICVSGHTLYGSAERICFPNGTWSGRQPFCKREGKGFFRRAERQFKHDNEPVRPPSPLRTYTYNAIHQGWGTFFLPRAIWILIKSFGGHTELSI